MNNKRFKKCSFLIGVGALIISCISLSSCGSVPPIEKKNICMVTDSGDITDESFNQNTWEGCKLFEEVANSYGLDVKANYKKPSSKDTPSLVETIELAIDQGYGTLVLPGFNFCSAIKDVAPRYPGVKFISLDTDEASFGSGYVLPNNVYACTYQDELCGFMAGFAAAKEGYLNLGFLGGQAVFSVKRYGYGFVQGIDYYASLLGNDDNSQFNIRYVYGNQFFGDSDIKARMDTWYKDTTKPTDVVFCCGGGIYTSACEAALAVTSQKRSPKVIGVDVDQGPLINRKYHEHMCLTSAMKGLKISVYNKLVEYVAFSKWESKYDKLSFDASFLESKNPDNNFVQLSPSSFGRNGYPKELNNFTYEEYTDLAVAICKANLNAADADKTLIDYIKVDISKDEPNIKNTSKVKFEHQGFIK